jgi:hypothetical protein
MLNKQEAAKIEYQNVTGKVHGFNDAWASAVGISKKTVEEYNRIAKKSAELRKKSGESGFSGISNRLLREYASAPTEVQKVVQELLTDGEKVTPKDIRKMREPIVIEGGEVWDEGASLNELIDMAKSFGLATATKTRSVYVITNPGFPDWVKIGMSNDVPKRLADFQTASPYEYKSLLVAELPHGMRDLSIHDFAEAISSDKSGEWFQVPSEKAVALVRSLIDLASREAA